MSTQNVISLSLDQKDVDKAHQALDQITAAFGDQLIALTPEQRRTIPKMSDGTIPFVHKVMDYVQGDEQFAPPFLDIPELKKDFDAVQQLMPILRKIQQLESKLNDSIMMAGSESYVASLSYYNSVKLASRMNIPGAKAVYDDLKVRFDNSTRRSRESVEA